MSVEIKPWMMEIIRRMSPTSQNSQRECEIALNNYLDDPSPDNALILLSFEDGTFLDLVNSKGDEAVLLLVGALVNSICYEGKKFGETY